MKNSFWKKLSGLLLASLAAATCFTGCALLEGVGSSDDKKPDSSIEEEVKVDLATKYEHISIAQAIELANNAGDTHTVESYTIVGTVKAVSNPTYGEMTVVDETGELYVYGTMSKDEVYYDSMEEKPVKGDQIVLKGVLMAYKGTPQMAAKDKKAVILDWYHPEVEIDETEYAESTLLAARAAEAGAKVKVDGVVAAITYANGKKPNGIMLVDETSSIYVYDGDLAAQVAVGNKIQIAASKTYWILETEKKNAELHGYKGACQLEETLLLSNDKGENAFDKSWIQETTVKKLLDTPVSENITTLLYKTTAYVEKRQGTGFVNYYITDLDGETATYTYTQCNGSDFAWLDAYDGKICEIYLTALNAKSAPAECFFRFLPVAVNEKTNFVYPEANVAQFAIDYAVADLLKKGEYGSDPAIELPNSYKNELFGDTAVALAYAASNATVATLTVGADTTVLNLVEAGTSSITVTATYKGYTATKNMEVKLVPVEQIVTPTVSEIIAKADGTKVQVRGVVMSSLVNRDGFYLSDETGMIAVLTTGDVLAQINVGDEVVMEGYKIHFKKDASTNIVGQCAIVGSMEKTSDSKLLANYYGGHEYSTAYFTTGKTIDDLYTLDINTDYTNNVYKLNAKVVVEGSQYYSNILLQDENGTNKLRLYCASSNQYSWLKAFEGQVVEIEIAVCNWNDKDYYTGCVISVTANGQKIVNELNFAK